MIGFQSLVDGLHAVKWTSVKALNYATLSSNASVSISETRLGVILRLVFTIMFE